MLAAWLIKALRVFRSASKHARIHVREEHESEELSLPYNFRDRADEAEYRSTPSCTPLVARSERVAARSHRSWVASSTR